MGIVADLPLKVYDNEAEAKAWADLLAADLTEADEEFRVLPDAAGEKFIVALYIAGRHAVYV